MGPALAQPSYYFSPDVPTEHVSENDVIPSTQTDSQTDDKPLASTNIAAPPEDKLSSQTKELTSTKEKMPAMAPRPEVAAPPWEETRAWITVH